MINVTITRREIDSVQELINLAIRVISDPKGGRRSGYSREVKYTKRFLKKAFRAAGKKS